MGSIFVCLVICITWFTEHNNSNSIKKCGINGIIIHFALFCLFVNLLPGILILYINSILITVRTTFFLFNWRLSYNIFESLTFSIKCGLDFFYLLNVKRMYPDSSILLFQKEFLDLSLRTKYILKV